ALGRLGHEQAVKPLIAALNDQDWQVRGTALEALARLGQRDALTAVLGRLNDPDPEVREAAADTTAALGDEQVIEPLLPNLVDVHAGVRQATLRALNRISPNWERSPCVQNMVGRLQAAAKHDDSGVQYAAVTLLKRITGLSTTELSQASERARAAARAQRIAEVLSALLHDRDAAVRLAAAEAIGRERSPACADALRQALDDPDHWVQVAVREALAALSPSSLTTHA
ncbi:MAG TPA: HEAT repeat domain-containing protein, partial [Verrucomicrobiae bacterium]